MLASRSGLGRYRRRVQMKRCYLCDALWSEREVVETCPDACRKEEVVDVCKGPPAVSSGGEFRSMEVS